MLAIAQTVQEQDGQNVVHGQTAQLALTPRQTETLALSRQRGTLSLTLRALAESKAAAKPDADDGRSGNVNIVRYGVNSVQTIK